MDDDNRKIISQLQVDGRTTFKDLGKLIGFTSMGAKKRVDNLLKNKVIKISALFNPNYLNLCLAIVLIEMESSEAMERLLKRFKECPRVVHIFTTIGEYNLIALMVAEDLNTLDSISVEKCSLRSEKEIRRSEFYLVGSVQYSPFLPIREYLTQKGLTIAPCEVNCASCGKYRKRCVGCPATKYYQGPL